MKHPRHGWRSSSCKKATCMCGRYMAELMPGLRQDIRWNPDGTKFPFFPIVFKCLGVRKTQAYHSQKFPSHCLFNFSKQSLAAIIVSTFISAHVQIAWTGGASERPKDVSS